MLNRMEVAALAAYKKDMGSEEDDKSYASRSYNLELPAKGTYRVSQKWGTKVFACFM